MKFVALRLSRSWYDVSSTPLRRPEVVLIARSSLKSDGSAMAAQWIVPVMFVGESESVVMSSVKDSTVAVADRMR